MVGIIVNIQGNYVFIQKGEFENIICEMAAILLRQASIC